MAKKRKQNKRKRRSRIPRSLPIAFPETFTTKLKYVQVITLDAAASGIPAQHNFRANSIYDPDASIGGGQPMGRDQFTVVYDHYTVIGSKCNVKFYTSGDYKQNVAMWCGGLVQDTENVFTNLPELLEQPRVKGKMLMTSTTDGKDSSSLTLKYSPRKMFKLGKGAIVGNSRICAQAGENPDEDAIFSLIAVQPDGSSIDPNPIRALVTIEYIVVFSEKRPLPRS